MKWLKKMAIDFAADYAKKYLTVENILNWCSELITAVLKKASSSKNPELVEKVCVACELYGAVFTEVAKSAKDGEVTAEEVSSILVTLQDATSVATVTDAKIAEVIGKAADALKEKV